ncbi:MAG: hypothetical protein DIU78_013130 [Pseudomonadota bacterium]
MKHAELEARLFRSLVWLAGAWLWCRRNWLPLLTAGAVLALIVIVILIVLDDAQLPGVWLGGVCLAGDCGGRP